MQVSPERGQGPGSWDEWPPPSSGGIFAGTGGVGAPGPDGDARPDGVGWSGDGAAPVRGVHALTAPTGGPLELYDFEVQAMALSAQNWKACCGPVSLFVDERACRFVERLGLLPLYDDVRRFEPSDFEGINRSYFWAAGKLAAANRLHAPFVIMDLDCLVHRRPRFRPSAAAQALHLELPYECYRLARERYGPLLPQFSADDWDAPPINAGLVGYYDEALRKSYLEIARWIMRHISTTDPDFPGLRRYADHIIFVEQKLLPVAVRHARKSMDVFEDGTYHITLATERTTHLWALKGWLQRAPHEKRAAMARLAARHPRIDRGISNPLTVQRVTSPCDVTAVFGEPGEWRGWSTKGWSVSESYGSYSTCHGALSCPRQLDRRSAS